MIEEALGICESKNVYLSASIEFKQNQTSSRFRSLKKLFAKSITKREISDT